MSGAKKEVKDAVALIISATDTAKTMEELQELLSGMAYAIGGMVCHFGQEDRSGVIIGLTQAMGMGLQSTAKHIGEPSDIEIVVGHGQTRT